MNKQLIAGAAIVSIAVIIWLVPTSHINIENTESNQNYTDLNNADKSDPVPVSKNSHMEKADSQLNSNHTDGEVGFDFTPYISQDMADEIRPYTSRSHKGLEVKIDKDGNEYVDLKKRWSHATVSVVDENGVKHTGEWAPK
jgi:hypothetical protein